MSAESHLLTEFAGQSPLAVGVGHMLINISDPHPGHQRDFGRWYEDDHFFSGALMAPFVLSGRRWVAPAELQSLQYSDGGDDLPNGRGASYAATYFIAPDHLNDYFAWSAGAGAQLQQQDRNFADRDLVFVSFADRIGGVRRSSTVPDDLFALMDPPGGMVVQMIDAPDADSRDKVIDWLTSDFLPSRLAAPGASAHRVILFRGAADTSAMRPALRDLQTRADNAGRRILALWFLDTDPRTTWETEFATLPGAIIDSGRASVRWMAPYLPARMGTDDYVDELGLD